MHARLAASALALLVVTACGSEAGSAPPSGASATVATASPSAGAPTAAATTATSSQAVAEPVRIALSGAAPDAIVLDGDTAWVLAGEGGTLMEVDLVGRREVRAIPVGFGATHVAIPMPGTAAVARFDNSGSGSYLVIVDLATGTTRGVATDELGAMTAGDNGAIWALEKDGDLLRVDAVTAAITRSEHVAVGENVHIEVQWGASSAWVGSDGLPVERYRGDPSLLIPIQVPTGIPFLFESGLMWGAGPTELWAIDPATNTVTRHVPLENVMEILGLDIDGDDAWLAVRHPGYIGAVLRLDLASGAIVDEFAVSLPAAVKLDADRAWVASYMTNELLGFKR